VDRFEEVEDEVDTGADVLVKTVGWEMAMEAVGRLATFLLTTGCRAEGPATALASPSTTSEVILGS
jgi:hypothetical protein